MSDAPMELVRRMFALERAHDAAGLVELAAENVEFDDFTARVRARGRGEFRTALERAVRETPDLGCELLFGFADARYFFAETEVTGRRVVDAYGGRGPAQRIRRWSIGEVGDGHLLRRRDYWDSALARR